MKASPCASCGAKLKGEPHFCPKCRNPTPFVTPQERTEWEVQQWRAHEARQKGGSPPPAAARPTASDAGQPEMTRPPAPATGRDATHPEVTPRPTPGADRAPTPQPPLPREHRPRKAPSPSEPAAPRRSIVALPKWRPRRPRFGLADRFRDTLARVTTPRPSPENDARNADVSPDDPWAYRACPRCEDAGWVVRLGGHAEGYRRYWCVRCWREFKSSVWLPHARKPFIAAAAIPVALVVIVQLL